MGCSASRKKNFEMKLDESLQAHSLCITICLEGRQWGTTAPLSRIAGQWPCCYVHYTVTLKNTVLLHLRFSQRYYWRFYPSGMLCCVDWKVNCRRIERRCSRNVCKYLLVPSIIRGQAVQDPFKTARCWMWMHYGLFETSTVVYHST